MQEIKGFLDYKSSGWDSFFQARGDSWRNKDYRNLSKMLPIHEFEGSLLDVGCALGDGFEILQSTCRHVTSFSGTDFSGYAIKMNQKNQKLDRVHFFQHDILEPIPDQYDNIICLQTLEHLADPQIALRNLIDATRRILVVATPYMNRRPDENHLWSFDENDFAGKIDEYCLDAYSGASRHRNMIHLATQI
jgi:2-polyprenyl-3-methyl-5-hydroxy-6-metoxy-1,4-benzoquinol methylase